MTALVTKHLPLVGGSPDGTKKLRALILDLAVCGKLVRQSSTEEDASHLVEKMNDEQTRLLSQGQIRRARKADPVDPKNVPFKVPDSWRWVRLGSVGHDLGQAEPSADFTYIDVGAVNNRNGTVQSPQVLSASEAPSRARKIVRSGSVIYSTIRPYLLNVAVIEQDYSPPPIASTAFAIIQPYGGLLSRYLFWWLRSQTFIKYVESVQTGIAYPAINDAQFFSGLLPLPPHAEQHRIVAKVDELMALCDRLEADQADAQAAHTQLVQALLGSLTQVTDAADFRASWQRLSEHFHTLFTTEASIDALKQTVLQLAVMGVLTQQMKADASASNLLADIAADATKYCSEHKAPQPVPTPVSEGDKLFAIPNGWRWARLQSLFRVITDGDHQAPPRADSGIAFLTIGNVTSGSLEFDGCREVESNYFAGLAAYRKPTKGDLLYTVVGATYGRPVLVETTRPFCVQRHIAIFKRSDLLVAKFGLYMLGSPLVYGQATACVTGTAQPTVPLKPLRNILVPLPPLAEQHRIVAKVDELMALCDQLKAQLAEARQQHAQLASVLVEQAVA